MAIKYVDGSYNTAAADFGTPKQLAATITAISKAASAVVTAVNDFAINDVVSFASVAGMTEINGRDGTISAASATSFTVNIDSTLFTTYTSAGTATKQMSVSGSVRLLYDDTVSKSALYMAMDKIQEWISSRL